MNDTINLSIVTFVVTILAGLYPAIMAARLQPIEALRAEK
jgi:ABC-type antimicrobial peptide transport system permease subunit